MLVNEPINPFKGYSKNICLVKNVHIKIIVSKPIADWST